MLELQIEEIQEIQKLIKGCITKEVIIMQFDPERNITIASKEIDFSTLYTIKKKAYILSLFENRDLFNILFINDKEIIYKKMIQN